VRPILEATGLRSGTDFFLAFSPEREDPGNADFSTARIPKVVGGDGSTALALADALYSRLVVRTVPVSSAARLKPLNSRRTFSVRSTSHS
jgi:UDP-N-acetyl-D-glucosamine dehydrogenase